MTIEPTIRPEIKKENERRQRALELKKKTVDKDSRLNDKFYQDFIKELKERKDEKNIQI